MNTLRSLAAAALCATVTGCFQPAHGPSPAFHTDTAKQLPCDERYPAGCGRCENAGLPAEQLAGVRKNVGEISYLEGALWAERSTRGLRVFLAANLSGMIPTDQVLLGAWHTDDVTLEVHVTVEQFDVDQGGNGYSRRSGASLAEARRFSKVGKAASQGR